MKRWKGLAVIAALLAACLMAASAEAYTLEQGFMRFKGTAGETLATGQLVMLKDADGYVYKADANDSNLRPAVGIVGGKGATSGQTVEVIVVGIFSGWSSLAEGGAAYLSETPGAVTQSAPTWAQQVGYAISTTEYLLDCRGYLDTSSITAVGTLAGTTAYVIEGTADDYEATVAHADPTADRTFTWPDAASGYVHVASVTAHDATGNITAAECWGGTVTNTGAGGAVVLTLPVAVVGMEVTVYLTVAQDVDVNPQNGTTILALTNAAGDAISSAATIGNFVTLRALSTTTWAAVGSSGTWSDVD